MSNHASLTLVDDFCGGVGLYWTNAPDGEGLQGWYKSKTQARKAHAAMPPLKTGEKIKLVLTRTHTEVSNGH